MNCVMCAKLKPKPWKEEYFDIHSAARYLKITEVELINLMRGRRVRKIRDKEDLDYSYDETRFKWEDIYRLRGVLDEKRRIEKSKPTQLDLL